MVSDKYEKELAFAKELAVQAREIALRYYKTELEFETKADESPVTVADKEVNDMVISGVQSQFPEHGVLGEEQSWHEERSSLWVCDPIDGTIAFSMGEPVFMFSLAFVEDGAPVVAVVADLASGTIFSAVKGGGSFADDNQIRVSRRSMSEAWLVFPTNLKRLYESQAMYQALAEKAYQTNIVHGGVFKGTLIAQGLADGLALPGSVHPWDMAAVKLIVNEAGGKFTDRNGGQHRFDRELSNGVIVSNGVIHGTILDIVENTLG